MEVLIYVVGALVTFLAVWVNGEETGMADRFWISFGFAGVWPVIWMFFIPVVIAQLVGERDSS